MFLPRGDSPSASCAILRIFPGRFLQPLATGTRWHRGDLHMDTAHSKAEALSQRIGVALHTARGATITVHIHTIAAEGSFVHLLLDGADSNTTVPLKGVNSTAEAVHWLRLEVRGPQRHE